jgi:hypothetical protein
MSDEFGKLIWRGFYGPPRNFLGWDKPFLRLILEMYVGFPLMGAAFILLSNLNLFKNIGWFVLLFGLAFPTVLIVGRLFFTMILKKEHFARVRSGKLDWDLHENGIMAGFDSDKLSDEVERRFLPFNAISRVHFNLQTKDMEHVLEKRRERDKNAPGFNPLEYAPTKSMERTLKNSIWLESTDSFLIYELEKEGLRDAGRFESILRQKVKSVE